MQLDISAAATFLLNLITQYASPYVSYFFRFGKNVEEFKNHRDELDLKQNSGKSDVDRAERQGYIIEHKQKVLDWLDSTEKELVETQSLEDEIERKKCFNWCPSWGWRYCLSMKVAKKTASIEGLVRSCPEVRCSAQRMELPPPEDVKPFKSSESTFRGIIKALKANDVTLIGLHGMPGVGKSTLAEKVKRHATDPHKKLFDKVVMVVMSQTPNISRIQDQIAKKLGFALKESYEEEKAEELWWGLKAVNKILIIVDDVWNDFKLRTIGIPFGVEHEGCKILLTTRDRRVCVRMDCQQIFKLNILFEDEAWALFKDKAGLTDVSSTALNAVAKEVARECKGLPLAIVSIGSALKGVDLNGWEAANQRLKDSRHLDNEDICGSLYKCLKLSYDYLKADNIRKAENIQSCFLLCSFFPEDYHIGIEWLIMFGIGYGLFSNVNLIRVLRMEIREAVRILQESGLLLKIDDDDDDGNEIFVSMHDVVRDFAHWIASKEENKFMIKEGLTEWPTSKSRGCYRAISLWNSNIKSLPDNLEFSELKIFIFSGNNLVKFSNAFFKGMKALRVLFLTRSFSHYKYLNL